MIEAKLSLPRRFYFLPPTQDLGIADLTLQIFDNDGTELDDSPYAATVMSPPLGVYQTAAITFATVGTYWAYWSSAAAGLKDSLQFLVVDDPLGDYSTLSPRKYRYEAPSFDTGKLDIVLDIYDGDGALVSAAPIVITSSSIASPTVITTATAHGFTTGDQVVIANHAGSTPAVDGAYVATVTSLTEFTVPENVTIAGTGGTVRPAAIETAIGGIYETPADITIVDEGTYLFAWTSAAEGYSYTFIEQFLVLLSADLRLIEVTLVDNSVAPPNPLRGVEALLSTTAGVALQQTTTNGDGKVYFSQVDGSYIVVFRNGSLTYSKNNLAITVADPTDTVNNPNQNSFTLLVSPFTPNFDASPPISAASYSTGSLDLVCMDGTPIVRASILISLETQPTTLTGLAGQTVGVMGDQIQLQTDGNGHAEVQLIRGTSVVVAFEGTSLRRTITVPDTATFDILALVAAGADPFDIVIPQIATAVPRV